MTSPINYVIDDKDLDDAALWEVIDSAAASLSSVTSKSRKPLFATKHTNQFHHQSPNLKLIVSNPSPPIKLPKNPRNHHSTDGEVLQDRWTHHRPLKMARSSFAADISETVSPPLAMVKHLQRTPTTPKYSSPDTRRFEVNEYSPIGSDCSPMSYGQYEEKETPRHSLAGRFPSVSLFKEYQNAAMAILEKSDYTMISGNPFIKKSGWRKISFYFNLSYEIKDKTIEFDENRNVQRAEFVVRAHMQGGRFSDGWGSCERREKRFLHPNHDIPSTAETRAKNKACQDLLGIGEYRPGASHAQR